MTVHRQDEGQGVTSLTLDRPPANAFSPDFVAELDDAVQAVADDDDVRAVVVRGNDRFFSGGLDLKALAGGALEALARFGDHDAIFRLWTLPKPTIAEINGHAIAGGAILALACDVRIAADKNLKVGLNESALGIAFPRGAFEIARYGLDSRHFREVILGGEMYDVQAAHRLGFVSEIVPEDSLRARALEVAQRWGSYGAAAYGYNKRLLQEAHRARIEARGEAELAGLRELWGQHPAFGGGP